MNRIGKSSLLGILCMLAIGTKDAFAQNTVARGVGALECTVLLNIPAPHRQQTHDLVAHWTLGYLSALSMAEFADKHPSAKGFSDRLQGLDQKVLTEAIVAQCKVTPAARVGEVVFGIYRQLGGRLYH